MYTSLSDFSYQRFKYELHYTTYKLDLRMKYITQKWSL